jgi:hypothetical protein
MREKRTVYRLLVGEPEGKRPLGRPRCKLAYNIKMDLVEKGWVVWTGLAWLRRGKSENFCAYGNEPLGSIKCWETKWLHNW